MQIELVGCTSAGKSTLASTIIHECRDLGFEVILDQEFVLRQFHLNWVGRQQLRKVMINLLGLAASLITWRRNRDFYRFAIHQLFHPLPTRGLGNRGPDGGPDGLRRRIERLHLLRNILKRVGICEIIRHYDGGTPARGAQAARIVLVDEGTLQTAHNLFVHLPGPETGDPLTNSALPEGKASALATFVTLVPLADIVVYLRQPEELLIQRTLQRGHRRVGNGSYGEVTSFVHQAVSVFDTLVQHPLVADRVLVVETRVRKNSAHNGHHHTEPGSPTSGPRGAGANHVA